VHNFGGGRLKAEPTIQPKFTAYDAVSGADLGQTYPRRVWLGSRSRPTPIYYQSHAGNVDFANQGDTGLCAPRVSFFSVVASSPGSFSCTLSYSGLTATLTFGAGRTEAIFAHLGPHTGDVIYDQGTSTTMYVSGRSGTTVTCEIQNNFRDIGAGPVPRTTWPTTGSTLYVANSRLYTTSDLYFGTFSAGSAIITNVERWDRNCFIEAEIAVGDYLNTPFELGLISNRPTGFVTARSNSGKTITLDGVANTSAARVPLWNWFAFY